MLKKLRSKRGIVIGYLVLFPVALILAGHIGREAGKMGTKDGVVGTWAVDKQASESARSWFKKI